MLADSHLHFFMPGFLETLMKLIAESHMGQCR